jgi:hypothetical protein
VGWAAWSLELELLLGLGLGSRVFLKVFALKKMVFEEET